MKQHITTHSLILFCCLCILSAAGTAGCGRKTYPVAPNQIEPAAVTDLAGQVDAGIVRLTWSVPASQPPVIRFVVYKAARPVSEADCENCPMLFVKAGEVPIVHPKHRIDSRAEFTERVKPGYIYTYKVIGMTDKDIPSEDSNLTDPIRTE